MMQHLAPAAIQAPAARHAHLAWLLHPAGTLIAFVLAIVVCFPAAARGVLDRKCPPDTVRISPDTPIQPVIERTAPHASFCLMNGIHRLQVIRPKDGQAFYGEGGAILNGSRRLLHFERQGALWFADHRGPIGPPHGQCADGTAACALPGSVFLDHRPLRRVLDPAAVKPGTFYQDRQRHRIYIADPPDGHLIEATVAVTAFTGNARNVIIDNITIEKYASPAQRGAIQSGGSGWTVRNCDIRLNSAGGVWLTDGGRLLGSNIHENGQIGVVGNGNDIRIENNLIWQNNTTGFDYRWEAGGIKIAVSSRVSFLRNHVFANVGPGIWCDIHCRDIEYVANRVENNHDAGIYHEISYAAVIRDNVVAHNGFARNDWFWGADILVAASEHVDIVDNKVITRRGGCAIVLIDQSRPRPDGHRYKTRHNTVRDNAMIFDGSPCAGAASDITDPQDPNYRILSSGQNRFERNTYSIPRETEAARLVWENRTMSWAEFHSGHHDRHGKLIRR